MPLDRILAAQGLFPLILGGHDHEAHLEVIPHQPTNNQEGKASTDSHPSPTAVGSGPTTRVSSRDCEAGASTVVVKVGVDCKAVGVTDVIWEGSSGGVVVVQSEMRDVGDYTPDLAVEKRVQVHLRVLEVRMICIYVYFQVWLCVLHDEGSGLTYVCVYVYTCSVCHACLD